MIREPRSSSLVSSKLLIPAKRSVSATRTSSKTMSAFCTVRSAILFSIRLRLTPGRVASTMKPRMPPSASSRAQTSM